MYSFGRRKFRKICLAPTISQHKNYNLCKFLSKLNFSTLVFYLSLLTNVIEFIFYFFTYYFYTKSNKPCGAKKYL